METSDYVCDRCVDDDELKKFIDSVAESVVCSFCGRASLTKPLGAPLDEVARFMRRSIDREYELAVDAMGWDNEEGEYWGAVYWDTWELLTEQIGLDFPNDNDGRLLDALVNCLGDEQWCKRDPYRLGPKDRLIYSWELFSRYIKHERRFFFLQRAKGKGAEPSEHLTPSELLKFMGEAVTEFDLVHTLQQGTQLYRARQSRCGDILCSPYELGPPPVESATRSNRMSPAGIVMFYASDDPNTAAAEIDDEQRLGVVVGTFQLTRDARVLDLTRLPRRVPFFQPDCSTDRYALDFLHEFVKRVAAKVEPGEREHIDYVPTQVVTEWFRTVFRHRDSHLDGIWYRSTQRTNGRSLVLFADRDDLVLNAKEIQEIAKGDELHESRLRWCQGKAWLKLVQTNVQRPPQCS